MKKEEIVLLIPFLVIVIIIGMLVITNYSQLTKLAKITGFVSYDQITGDKKEFVEGELIIKYKEGFIGNGNEIFIPSKNEVLVYEYLEKPIDSEKIIPTSELYNLKFDSGLSINEINKIISNYEKLPEVEYVEQNYLFETFVVPDDSNYSSQYSLKNINAEEAWNLNTGSNIAIAIIDTGVEWTHSDLVNNIWNNSDESCDNSSDLDNNSYKGDCRGYDFVDVSSGCGDSDCSDEDNNPEDGYGHGTHVAGIASASSNNSLGIAGICWNCSIMPVRAGYKDSFGNGVLTLADVIQALHYSADNNANIISMSFGGSHSASLQEAINYSSSKSILVASAGNQGSNKKQYPCGYENVICVAATNANNESASYSNYGEWVDLAAPGSSILSTYLNNNYLSQSGTSMSAPLVAGSIALIKSFFNKNQEEILTALNSTGSPTNFNNISINKIDVYKAILFLDDIKPNVSLIYPENNAVNETLNQTFSCESRDWQLKNITLQIYNTTNLYYKETKKFSGAYNSSRFSVLLNEDNYKWNCLSYDAQNNYYQSNNFSLATIKSDVYLNSPLNNSNFNYNEINFNCSAKTDNSKTLTNLTLLLFNSSSDLVYTSYKDISGINEAIFNYNFSYEDNYLWSCSAFADSVNNTELIQITSDNTEENNTKIIELTTNNFTIIYDITSPIINLVAPENGRIYEIKENNETNQEINFEFTISDKNEINSCSLIINNEINLTNQSIDKSLTQYFNIVLEPGNYNWKVSCTDKAGNLGNSESRSFSIEKEKESGEGGGEGGEEGSESEQQEESSESAPQTSVNAKGGEGGAGIGEASAKKTYFISEEQFLEGYINELKQNDEIKFYFQDENTFEHSLVINEISKDSDYVDITVQSEPINLRLKVGDEAKLNITNSNYYELYIKLNSIEAQKANFIIQLINETILNENNQLGITGKAVEETKPFDKLIKGFSWIIGLFIIIIIVIIVFLFKRKKREPNDLVK